MRIAVLVVIGALAGCVQAPDDRRAKLDAESNAVNAAKAQCLADYRAGKTKTLAGRARCENAAEEPFKHAFDDDLFRVRQLARVAIAERMDRGEITQAEAELEFARVVADFNTQQRARILALRSVKAQERSTTCNRVGNNVICY